MSAEDELATSTAKDFIPARPSARFGSCCMNDWAKYRSTAVASFLRKISIRAWRAWHLKCRRSSRFSPAIVRPGSAARLHVLARPLGKGGEAAGNEGIRRGDGGPRVRTEISMRLEVLVHLAQLLGAGEEAVKDLRRDPYDP